MLAHLTTEATIAIIGVVVAVAVALPQLIPVVIRAIKVLRDWNRPHIFPLHNPEVAVNAIFNLATGLYRQALSVPAHVDEQLRAGLRVTQERLTQLQRLFQPQPPRLPRWRPWFIRRAPPGGPEQPAASV